MKKQESARKLGRALSIVFALIFGALILYAFFSILLPQLEESIRTIAESAPGYYESINTWLTKLLENNPDVNYYVRIVLSKLEEFFDNWIQTRMTTDVQALLTTLTSSVVAIVRAAANLLIGIAASIYILASKDQFQAQSKKMIVACFSPERANRLLYLGREINRIFNGFVIGKIIDSAIIGVICYLGMLIFRLPYPALIATIVGVTNVVPFFGPIIGAIPSTLLILLVNPLQALYFVIFVVVLQQVDGNVIGPRILGNTVGISGFWVLFAITVGTGLFGFAGMILGVPVFAVIYRIVSDAIDTALKKKGQSTDADRYHDIQNVSELEEPEEQPEEQPEEPEEEPAEPVQS